MERLENEEEIRAVRRMIENHFRYTGSPRASLVLDEWDAYVKRFVKVIPHNYKLMVETIQALEQSGLSYDEAAMAAFETVAKQKKRLPPTLLCCKRPQSSPAFSVGCAWRRRFGPAPPRGSLFGCQTGGKDRAERREDAEGGEPSWEKQRGLWNMLARKKKARPAFPS